MYDFQGLIVKYMNFSIAGTDKCQCAIVGKGNLILSTTQEIQRIAVLVLRYPRNNR